MKKSIAILFLLAAMYTRAQQVKLYNPASVDRKAEIVTIPWHTLKNVPQPFKVMGPGGRECAYQLEYLGNANIENLLVQCDIPAKGTTVLKILKGTPIAVTAKTYARYVPERKQDFAWENDKIAFRMYGKELEKYPNEMAYGVDVWAKRTNKLILNERYKRGEYHIDHGDGLDYYHVGYTLGAGGIAPFVNDSVWYTKNYTSYKVLDNGPLRSTFILYYDAWNVAGRQMVMSKTISLDAGSQLNKVQVMLNATAADTVPVALGIIKRSEPGFVSINEQRGITAYWEPRHGDDGTTGVACIAVTPVTDVRVGLYQILTITNAVANQPFTYYQGACWDKAGEITNAEMWINYLEFFKNKLDNPVQIKP